MKKRFVILVILWLSVAMVGQAQEVRVEARMDSLAILIGEQVGMTLTVEAKDGASVVMPTWKEREMVTPGVEVAEVMADDTTRVDGRMKIERKVLLTSFDEDAYMIPAMKVNVEGRDYETNPLALKVLTVDVDTLNLDAFFPPKDVQDNPFEWEEWKGLFYVSIVIFLLIAMGLYVYIRYKQNKPIVSRIMVVRHVPAHQKALKEIERIKEDRSREDQKTYYTRLTDTLRGYIEERFGFNAMEMTSGEIIEALQRGGDARMLDELRGLFEVADLVKFAKHNVLLGERDQNLVNAVEFIDVTKTEDVEREERIVPQMSERDKRVSEGRRVMKIMLIVMGAAVVILLGIVVYKAMTLF